jgi:hypothetical protein
VQSLEFLVADRRLRHADSDHAPFAGPQSIPGTAIVKSIRGSMDQHPMCEADLIEGLQILVGRGGGRIVAPVR